MTFDEKATVEKVAAKQIPLKQVTTPQLDMHELVERGGAMDVIVSGTVLEIREGSGFILRCPDCNRSLQGDQCAVHGQVKGIEDLRLKLVLDDGTGVVSALIDKETTEHLLGKSTAELKKISEKQGQEALTEEIHHQLFTKHLKIQGNALSDDFGVTFITKHAEKLKEDMTTASQYLLEELEDLV